MSSVPQAPGDTGFTSARKRRGDTIFAGLSLSAGVTILVVLFLVAAFLLWQALPAITAAPEEVRGGQGLVHYIAPLLFGTVVAAVIALLVGTPLAIGIALFISHYAPRRLASLLGYIIDLLAAVPSVIFGLWGFYVFGPWLMPTQRGLIEYLGFIPLFGGPASPKSMLVTGLVLAIMILPIITSMSREIFTQTPKLHEEAALALGATRWEMIRMAVLPFARPGIISSIMLALGRALGETMAVALVLSSGPMIASLIKSGNQTIAAEIALNFPEAYGLRLSELIAAGLVLFLITLVVNMIARAIIARYKEFSGAN